MAIYRVLKDMARGKGRYLEAGSLSYLEWLKGRPDDMQRLLDVGAIAHVSPPPLRILPAWELRGERLAPFGITNAVELLEADPVALAEHVGVQPQTIKRWQREVQDCLTTPPSRLTGK